MAQKAHPRRAVDRLACLILAVPLDEAMFYGDDAKFRKTELDNLADGASPCSSPPTNRPTQHGDK